MLVRPCSSGAREQCVLVTNVTPARGTYVRKLVDVDVHAVDAVLGIHLALESWFPSPSESGFHIEYPSLLINNLSIDVLLEGV